MFWVPQSANIGLGVSILSFDGQLQFGLITDAALVPDPQSIVDRCRTEFETYAALTGTPAETHAPPAPEPQAPEPQAIEPPAPEPPAIEPPAIEPPAKPARPPRARKPPVPKPQPASAVAAPPPVAVTPKPPVTQPPLKVARRPAAPARQAAGPFRVRTMRTAPMAWIFDMTGPLPTSPDPKTPPCPSRPWFFLRVKENPWNSTGPGPSVLPIPSWQRNIRIDVRLWVMPCVTTAYYLEFGL